jgi:pimeloyl-ACP methyl ester carboxylesterase
MHLGSRPRTLASAALCLSLLAACTATVSAGRPGSSGHRPSVSGGSRSTIDWRPCHKTFQCGSLRVPLDWFGDRRSTIDLALIRRPADSGHPIGSLLVNPGGPGEPGVGFLVDLVGSGTVPKEVRDRFDLVSWDPRGAGESSGVACLTTAELLEPDPLPYPASAAARLEVTRKDDAQMARCLREDGKVIPYVGTRETVHDLDAIRAALGDDHLNYAGFSYGTAIGLEYLKELGSHVRAMVLDGIDLPGSDPVATGKAQTRSFEDNLDRFLAQCAADSHCEFGHGKPRTALMALLAKLETGVRLPADYSLPDDDGKRHDRHGTVGYTEALTGIATALYSEDTWSILRTALADATRAEDPEGTYLLMLRDLLSGRESDGTWNHSTEANAAITCADQTERATSDFGDPKLIARWSAEIPVFGAYGAVGEPGCYRWPAARYPLGALTRASLEDAPAMVLVNSRHDPATPYAGALQAHALLPTSRLVTWEGDDHTSMFGGHACIDDAVVAYLVSRTLPDAGLSCPATGG